MEEQVKLLPTEVRNVLISECKTAKYYTVIADSRPDISHKCEMAVLLRYVVIDTDKKQVCICERFIGYYHMNDGTATSIYKIIERVLFDDFKLDQKYLTERQ